MIRFALYDYIPQRFLNRATFEEIDLHRRILDFKDAKPYATRWAAKEIGYALSDMDLSDTYIVCIPACCKRTHDRRYKEFTKMVCEWCGAKNGFDFIQVFGHRQKAHIDNVYELADNADEFIHVDSQLKGKNIIVIDDIVTTGKTATAFIDRMVSAGANVKMAFFLAKTKYFKRYNDYNFQDMRTSTIKMSVKQWAEEDRPSTKLLNLGANTLTNAELISILVGSGTAQYNAVEIAQAILSRYDRDLSKLGKADLRELKEIDVVGTYTICKIMAAIELGKRRQLATMGLRPDISSADCIFKYMRPILQDLTIEEAHVMLLSQNYKLIKEMRVSQGGLTEVSVDVRMIIKEAVLNNATVLAFVHNHPSGNIHPSKFDDTLTQTLKKACDLMRIHLLDHVIVCDGDYYSYVERGRL